MIEIRNKIISIKRTLPLYLTVILLALTPHTASALDWQHLYGGSGIPGCHPFTKPIWEIGDRVYGHAMLDCRNSSTHGNNVKYITIEQKIKRSNNENGGYWSIKHHRESRYGSRVSTRTSQKCNNRNIHFHRTAARFTVTHKSGRVYKGHRYAENIGRPTPFSYCG